MGRPSEDDARASFEEASRQAVEADETIAAIASWPAKLTSLVFDPTDHEDLSPPRVEPHDEEMVLAYVGSRPSETLAEAFRIVGYRRLWLALLRLEPPTAPPDPTASLTQRIESGRVTAQTLEMLFADGCVHEMAAHVQVGDRVATVPLAHALILVREHVANVVRSWEAARVARAATAEQFRQVTGGDRGARGPLSGNARVLQFCEMAAQALLEAKWTRRRVAELVLESATWTKAPCREFVRALLADAGHDRTRAVTLLVDRIRKATSRRS